MPDNSITEKILSEDYTDLILPISISIRQFLAIYQDMGAQILGDGYGMIHVPLRAFPPNPLSQLGYYNIPKLYTLLDSISLEASGIPRVHNQPLLNYRGKDIILGFLDTGINYTSDVFRKKDGRTRIVGIWDQTDQSGTPPVDQHYGSAYTEEELNEALMLEDPFSRIPSRDTDGHGSFMASVAAGSSDVIPDFYGAAPDADIAMVKLKPAKQYLKDFYLIREDAVAFQETDLITGIQYLLSLAEAKKKPLVICIGLGTNQGSHSGASPLAEIIDAVNSIDGIYMVIAAGNEAGQGHHFAGDINSANAVQAVEILVGPDERGFCVEFWAQSPELYAVSLTSPLGESIPTIPARLGQTISLNFTLEKTRVDVSYEIVEAKSGNQLIFLRFQDPTPGVWTIRVENRFFINGNFHLWLPITTFISPETVFLSPNPDTTLTDPSSSSIPVTVSTYDAHNGSLYLHSSRGYTRSGIIKPDIAAPGVNVSGINENGRLISGTGSSPAAAITAGAIALLVNWRLDSFNSHLLTSVEVKNYLIRGASRSTDLTYPNRSWGYGTLDVYGIFESFL